MVCVRFGGSAPNRVTDRPTHCHRRDLRGEPSAPGYAGAAPPELHHSMGRCSHDAIRDAPAVCVIENGLLADQLTDHQQLLVNM